MIVEFTVLYCPTCRRDSIAEAPPCADGHDEHGERCPDRACVECGTALLLDAPLFAAEFPAAARPERTPRTRHAA